MSKHKKLTQREQDQAIFNRLSDEEVISRMWDGDFDWKSFWKRYRRGIKL